MEQDSDLTQEFCQSQASFTACALASSKDLRSGQSVTQIVAFLGCLSTVILRSSFLPLRLFSGSSNMVRR